MGAEEFPAYDDYDAVGLADLVARGEVSASDLVETAINRVELLNPTGTFLHHHRIRSGASPRQLLLQPRVHVL